MDLWYGFIQDKYIIMELQVIYSILGFLSSCAVLVAAIIILIKTKSVGSVVLLIGQVIMFLINTFWALYPILEDKLEMSYSNIIFYQGLTLISIFGSFIFAIGLFLLTFMNLTKKEIIRN